MSTAEKPTEETTHFGYQTVGKGEKTEKVHKVFESVAADYDRMNDAMSGGMHRVWKARFVDLLHPRDGMEILDVAGGTGDIAFRIAKRCNAKLTLCDINQEMLNVGMDRAIDKNIHGIEWVCGNAEELPFEDNRFDAYTISFGIRNVTDIPKALKDAYRVLKPGGKIQVLEFSKVRNPLLSKIYDVYSFQAIPRMGELIANDRDSYQYLAESIRRFPDQETFAKMLCDAGFSQVKYFNLTGGVCAIHSGWKTC